jgi:uncharacterized protein
MQFYLLTSIINQSKKINQIYIIFRKIGIGCIFIILFLLFIPQNSEAQKKLKQSKDNNTLLWEITGKGLKKTSYVFGTFHIMCKEDIRFSENLKQAIKTTNEVYFEMDLDDPKTMLSGLAMMNMKNKTLADLYTKEELDKLTIFFKDSIKMSLSFFNKMKPMLLEALLYPRMMPCKTPSGVETELMVIAKKEKKEIKGFETMEFQSAVFDSIPYEIQAKALLKDIDSTEKFKVFFNKMLDIYKNQETDKLAQMMADTTFSGGENDDALLKNRNINWVKQLKTILKSNTIFMAVGAGHLFGKDGLIVLLREEGYTLRAIENKK